MDHHKAHPSEGVIVEEKGAVAEEIRGDLKDQGRIGRHKHLAEQKEQCRQGRIEDDQLDAVGEDGTEPCRRGTENGIVSAEEQIFKGNRLARQKEQGKHRRYGVYKPGVLSVYADQGK